MSLSHSRKIIIHLSQNQLEANELQGQKTPRHRHWSFDHLPNQTLLLQIRPVDNGGLLKCMGVSQNDMPEPGSLSEGYVSQACFGVCFGGLFRVMFLGYVSPKSNFPILLEVHHTNKSLHPNPYIMCNTHKTS